MTNPGSDSASFWDSLLDRLEDFLEAAQDAQELHPEDKDSDHTWKPKRQDRAGGSKGFSEDGRLK